MPGDSVEGVPFRSKNECLLNHMYGRTSGQAESAGRSGAETMATPISRSAPNSLLLKPARFCSRLDSLRATGFGHVPKGLVEFEIFIDAFHGSALGRSWGISRDRIPRLGIVTDFNGEHTPMFRSLAPPSFPMVQVRCSSSTIFDKLCLSHNRKFSIRFGMPFSLL